MTRSGVEVAHAGTSRVALTAAGTAVVLVAAILAGVLIGPVDLGARGVVGELLDRLPLISVDSGLDERSAAILWQIRLPRVVLGLLVGATLSIAGGAYQGVFRNPLADPYLLGAAAGAGLGATIVIASDLGGGWGPFDLLPAMAFVGALVAVGFAYVVGRANADRAEGGPAAATSLVLAGVAVASLFTAVQTFVQQRDRDTVQEVYSWILGRLSTGGWGEVRLLAPFTVVAAAGILAHRRSLDVLAVGDEEAATLGLRVDRTRLWVVVAASLGTAAAVSVSGLIGFVGIIVPHSMRLLTGRSSFRVVLPLALLGGAAFLVLTDLAARTVMEPAEIPIGVVTAVVGAPFFLFLLTRRPAS
ncbi:MAG TPA: iron ABC transporter permease [Acidimicrobiales bacterium]